MPGRNPAAEDVVEGDGLGVLDAVEDGVGLGVGVEDGLDPLSGSAPGPTWA